MKIGNISSEPGEKKFGYVKVARMADGNDLMIPVHVLEGTKPGPTLCLISSTHGREEFNIEVIREIISKTDVHTLSGSIIALPVANPLAFEARTRNTPIGGFITDLNRSYPGDKDGTLTQKMAYAILHEIVHKATHVLDYHCGGYAEALSMTVPWRPSKVEERGFEIAKAYGLKIINCMTHYYGAISRCTPKMGTPLVGIGHGGGLCYRDVKYLKMDIRGVENVMKFLGMIAGRPILPQKQLVVTNCKSLKTNNGGLFYPVAGDLALLESIVPKDTLLGKVVSPYNFEVLEEIKAPFDKNVIIQVRGTSSVDPGDSAYLVGNVDTAEWIKN